MSEFHPIELTESEFEVLSVICELCREEECKLTWSDILTEVSRRRARQGRRSISKATLTQVLNKLVSLGLVEKQVEVKGVKLKVYYRLTEKGKAFFREHVISRIESKLRETVDLMASVMSPEEVKKTIMELVDKYLAERAESTARVRTV